VAAPIDLPENSVASGSPRRITGAHPQAIDRDDRESDHDHRQPAPQQDQGSSWNH
jgi:hypothetical protein